MDILAIIATKVVTNVGKESYTSTVVKFILQILQKPSVDNKIRLIGKAAKY